MIIEFLQAGSIMVFLFTLLFLLIGCIPEKHLHSTEKVKIKVECKDSVTSHLNKIYLPKRGKK